MAGEGTTGPTVLQIDGSFVEAGTALHRDPWA
jgi:hypothetical protein